MKRRQANPNRVKLEKASERIRGLTSTATTRRGTMSSLPTEPCVHTPASQHTLPDSHERRPTRTAQPPDPSWADYKHSLDKDRRLEYLTDLHSLKKTAHSNKDLRATRKFINTKEQQTKRLSSQLQNYMDKHNAAPCRPKKNTQCFLSYRHPAHQNYLRTDKHANQNMYDPQPDKVTKRIWQHIDISKYSPRHFDYIPTSRDYPPITPHKPPLNQATYYLDMQKQVRKQDYFKQWLKTEKEVQAQNEGITEDSSKSYFHQIQTFHDLYIDQGRKVHTNADQFLLKNQSRDHPKKHSCDLYDIFADKPSVLETQHRYIIQQDRNFEEQEKIKANTQERLQYKLKANQTSLPEDQFSQLPRTQLMQAYLSRHALHQPKKNPLSP